MSTGAVGFVHSVLLCGKSSQRMSPYRPPHWLTNNSTFLLVLLLGLAAYDAAAPLLDRATTAHRTVCLPGETTDAKPALQEAAPSDEQDTPWLFDPLHAGVTLGVVLALLLLVVFVRRRRQPAIAADTHVAVPDYLDPRRKIKVPRTELREPLDDQLYALHLGRVTFVVKIYWRHVHF